MDGRLGCFRDWFFFVYCVLVKLFSNSFAEDICTFSLNVGTPRWRWAWMMQERLRLRSSCECRELDLICFCSVWNVCLDWNRHLELVRNTLLFPLNHFVSHINSLCHNQPQPWRETQPLRLASIPSALFPVLFVAIWPIGRQILHWCSLLVTQQIYSALMKWAVCYWSVSSSWESSRSETCTQASASP